MDQAGPASLAAAAGTALAEFLRTDPSSETVVLDGYRRAAPPVPGGGDGVTDLLRARLTCPEAAGSGFSDAERSDIAAALAATAVRFAADLAGATAASSTGLVVAAAAPVPVPGGVTVTVFRCQPAPGRILVRLVDDGGSWRTAG